MMTAWSKVKGETAQDKLESLDDVFKTVKPSQLYKNGQETPFSNDSVADLENKLRAHPMHIVIVPGIFSEFIPVTPFEELFRADTAARREFAEKGSKVTDTRLFVADMKPGKKPGTYEATRRAVALTGGEADGSDALVRVGSIDDADQKPLVKVAYLKANTGSLEDFGTLEEDTATYLHRLDAYFKAVGQPNENVYLMGYSRGAVTGLDLLVKAKADVDSHPWAKNIKGFISHAGVIYGSQLADASFVKNASGVNSPSTELLNALHAFIADKQLSINVNGKFVEVPHLQSCAPFTDSVLDNAKIAARDLAAASSNKVAWAEFVTLAASISNRNAKHDEEFKAEDIKTGLPNPGRLANFALRTVGMSIPGLGDLLLGKGTNLNRSIVNLTLWDTNHCANIESFKQSVSAIIAGASSLTTSEREEWWATHVVPTDVKYFALTGTMGDATAKGKTWELATNDVAFDNGSVDFRSLRGNYYDFLAASGGVQVQDSQVAVQRGRFWPELKFNRKQGTIESYFMGTMGTHHWGLAFPRAFSSDDGQNCDMGDDITGHVQNALVSCGNPYPRTLLLKSIATFVAQVQTAK
jgi:hypothetical protein